MKKFTLIFTLIFAPLSTLFAQTAAPMPFVKSQFFTTAGVPAAGYKVCTYAAGTTTPATTYQDSNQSASNVNPVTLDAGGRANIFLGPSSYKLILYASGTGNTCNGVSVGAAVWTEDNISVVGLSAGERIVGAYSTVSYAASMTFDASSTTYFRTTLTGNVASSVISNATNGQLAQLTICQDGTGGRTFAWPGTVVSPPIVSAAASDCTDAAFYFDGTFWRPLGLNGTQSATGYKFTGTVGIVNNTAGAGVVTLATSSSSVSYTMTLPAALGVSGQYLQQTTTTGALAFASLPVQIPGGRLTTETGVPISTTDRTAQGTIYYTAYVNNLIWLYSGTQWVQFNFAETSLALTATSGKNYDVFMYSNSGTPTLELSAAWASDTARTDALTRQDGVLVKSGATTRLWLGTIRASGANVTADSIGGVSSAVGGQGFVCNYYNAVRRPLKDIDTTSTWSYTSATIRQANAATGNKVEVVVCQVGLEAEAVAIGKMGVYSNITRTGNIGVGLDTTTAFSGLVTSANNEAATNIDATVTGSYAGYPGIGYHYLSWNESGLTAGGSVFYGSGNNTQSGLIAHTFR